MNKLKHSIPGGGTQIRKWRTSAYRRTKIGGIRCKISSKKGGHSVWAPNKAVLEPRVSPAFAITYFCNHCNIRFENTSKYVDTLFSKNLNQRSLTPRWPLTPCLLRSHVWLYPRIIVSKSHDNTSMYVDTVINFAKYHIHTHTYYIQNEWSHSLLLNSVQARQKIGAFLMWTLKYGGHSVCKNAISRQNLQIFC